MIPVYNFTPFPQLTTSRLTLRRITQQDVAEVMLIRSAPELLEFTMRPPCQSLHEAAAFINKIDTAITANDAISWGVYLKDTTLLIGDIAIWRIQKDHHRGEVGYGILPAYQRKGLMSEALGAIIHYGFHVIGLHSLEANTDPRNIASHKLLEQLGFVREGLFKENFYYDGHYYDTASYSLLTSVGRTNQK